MKNISNRITATPEAECIWHKITMNDYYKRNNVKKGEPTFPKNHYCAMTCNGYDFDCKDYDSLARQRALRSFREKGWEVK